MLSPYQLALGLPQRKGRWHATARENGRTEPLLILSLWTVFITASLEEIEMSQVVHKKVFTQTADPLNLTLRGFSDFVFPRSSVSICITGGVFDDRSHLYTSLHL